MYITSQSADYKSSEKYYCENIVCNILAKYFLIEASWDYFLIFLLLWKSLIVSALAYG
jgi:hypothetical protein